MNLPLDISAAPGPTVDHGAYLGASDIGVIAGESEFARDALDVWAEKKGLLRFEGTDATELGNAFERPMLQAYARRRNVQLTFPGTLIHPRFSWAGATPDAIEDGAVDIDGKVVGYQMRRHWGEEQDGPDGIPPSVLCQVHWQSWLIEAHGLRVDRAKVVACFGTELRVYTVPLDRQLLEALIQIGHEWWQRYIVGTDVPAGRNKRTVLEAQHPAPTERALVYPTDEARDLVHEYVDARAAAKAAKERQDAIGDRICELIGDGSGFADTRIKASWLPGAATTRWRELALRLGATREQIEAHTAERGRRRLDVRVKGA